MASRSKAWEPTSGAAGATRLADASARPLGRAAIAPRRLTPDTAAGPLLPSTDSEAGDTSASPDIILAARDRMPRNAFVAGTRPRMSASSAADSCKDDRVTSKQRLGVNRHTCKPGTARSCRIRCCHAGAGKASGKSQLCAATARSLAASTIERSCTVIGTLWPQRATSSTVGRPAVTALERPLLGPSLSMVSDVLAVVVGTGGGARASGSSPSNVYSYSTMYSGRRRPVK